MRKSAYILASILMLTALPALADEYSDRVDPRYFQPGVVGQIRSMVTHDGQVFIAGNLSRVRETEISGIAAWDLATKTWDDLDGGLAGTVIALTPWADGVVALMGTVTYPEPQPQIVQYWNGESWQELGEGLSVPASALAAIDGQLFAGTFRWNGVGWEEVISANGSVLALLAWQDRLVISGDFTEVGGVPARGIATWDGEQFHPMGAGLDGVVRFLVESEGDLVAAGSFCALEPGDGCSVVRWGGDQWQGTNYSLGYFGNSILSLGTFQGHLLVGCFATNFGGNIHYGQIQTAEGPWEVIPGSLFQDLRAFCEIPNGLLIGGSFSGLHGVGSPNLIHWKRDFQTSDLFPGHGVDGEILCGLVHEDDLVLGGRFGAAGSVQASKLAVFNGESWVARDSVDWDYYIQPFHPASSVENLAAAGAGLASQIDMYASYYYASVNGFWNGPQNFWETEESDVLLCTSYQGWYQGIGPGGIWERNPYENTWERWATVSGGSVRYLGLLNGVLVVGGNFDNVSGFPCSNFAYYDGGWYTQGDGLPGTVTYIGVLDNHAAVAYENAEGDYQVSYYKDGAWTNLGEPFDDGSIP